MKKHKTGKKEFHRFLDESGDTTFFGKNKRIIVSEPGVSKTFILGMVKIKANLSDVRNQIIALQNEVVQDDYYKNIPSVIKRQNKYGYYFHAKDDIPEIREKFFRFIKSLNCSYEAVVGRKIVDLYLSKHHSEEVYFYADLLSHLLKNKFTKHEKLVLNVASRGRCTKNKNLDLALAKAKQRFGGSKSKKGIKTKIVFNVQSPITEPLLCIPDYFSWAVQNVFERGNVRFYDYLSDQISQVVDLYDFYSYDQPGWKNYYGPKNK